MNCYAITTTEDHLVRQRVLLHIDLVTSALIGTTPTPIFYLAGFIAILHCFTFSPRFLTRHRTFRHRRRHFPRLPLPVYRQRSFPLLGWRQWPMLVAEQGTQRRGHRARSRAATSTRFHRSVDHSMRCRHASSIGFRPTSGKRYVVFQRRSVRCIDVSRSTRKQHLAAFDGRLLRGLQMNSMPSVSGVWRHLSPEARRRSRASNTQLNS